MRGISSVRGRVRGWVRGCVRDACAYMCGGGGGGGDYRNRFMFDSIVQPHGPTSHTGRTERGVGGWRVN